MTITEKILAAHAGLDVVKPGQIIKAKVDFALANDITAPLAIKAFKAAGGKKVFDKDRIALILDHFTPNKDIPSAIQCQEVREFAYEQNITHFYDVGQVGIEHVFLPEKGLVLPGDLVIGADSHTCTYGALGAFSTGVGSTDLGAVMLTGEIWLKVPASTRLIYKGNLPKWVMGKDLILHTIGDIGVEGALYKAMEFGGEAISQLSMDSRFTMANMAIEAGAKNGIFIPDEKTENYIRSRAQRKYYIYQNDEDANYVSVKEYNISNLEPQIALPHSPGNVRGISEIGEIKIDQVVIGSCTNGRIEDLQVAASLLRGHKIAKGVRCIVIPATQMVYLEALRQGIIEIFIKAGAAVSTPTCGPCLGGHMGVLAPGEKAISTTNRNFIGRMGHPQSEVYLSNPAVAAASAIAGKIISPEEIE
ncbi:Homoaconitase/3-isopropylmalate dehydratase, large subunit, subgroup [Candidatus Desulfofervidus auxilii]|uniref:3-isopropylmalate dehydratase large subunit n=2 Tax=Desulfofervidus auxilii TaxID=1621989 RepID=A0A7U4QIW9_DESA2|nr:3-isopropylmalate dehydratase large subunit [Candidatus Desulfofervidus auxilii]AMM40145.1 Homoaconitase/3-isopropylmalate dehydratase, large subunit, subgroup [Candidatus Desulfofervidus auxilii]